MRGAQRRCDSASRLTAEQCTSANVSKATSKPNRLSRSFRQTQQPSPADHNSPRSVHIEFKTPTRLHKSRRYISGFTGESPHSDSDFQQDIIWDPTSPPIRAGKSTRNRSANAGVVDISDIVNRIAPKHGRPRVAEPTLQQWIGDSATIPCTPDVQHPKFKRKSPRLNAVDDLLKLAKEFDLNMFRQDKEEAGDDPQQSLELLSEDLLDLENSQEDVLQPMHPEASLITRVTSTGRDCQLHQHTAPDQHMENGLDFLFDGPTQQVSGRLSQTSLCQTSLCQPSEVKPASTVIPKEVSGNISCSSQCPTSTVIATHIKGALAVIDFEDDWENDNLLNDSLMFEMTQTPPKFAPPKHSSTQRESCEVHYQRDGPANRDVTEKQNAQSSVSKTQREIGKDRLTFQPEATPDFQVKKIFANTTNCTSETDKVPHLTNRGIKQSIVSCKVLSIKTSSQNNKQMQLLNKVTSNPKDSLHSHRAAITHTSTKHSTFTAENNSMRLSQAPVASVRKPVWKKDDPVVPALGKDDLLDDEMESLFSSDFVWDDQLDDDLLCEMCDDLESQTESAVGQPVFKQPLSVSQTLNQGLALAPLKRAWDNNNQQTEVKQLKQVSINSQSAPLRGATYMHSSPENVNPVFVTRGSSSLPGKSAAVNSSSNSTASLRVSSGRESCRQDLNSHKTSNTTFSQRSGLQPAVNNTLVDKNHFTFKPSNPVSTVTSTEKCSAAEIELKKQQAMERRRQRKQTTQNLRAPT